MKRSLPRVLALALALCGLCLHAAAQPAARPLRIDDLLRFKRVGDPQLSPDGRSVAYAITTPDVAANRNVTQIYLVPSTGGEPRQLTGGESSATSPRWSPDGRLIAFVRDGQIHTLDVAGGETRRVTNISTGASDPVWSPDGRLIAFVSDVYPDC